MASSRSLPHAVARAEAVRPGAPKSGLLAVKELKFPGNPRFPLKGSFKGDMDIDIRYRYRYRNLI